jgi:hypothetical protein
VQVVLAWPSPDWNERAGDSGRGCSSAQDWVRMQDSLDGADMVHLWLRTPEVVSVRSSLVFQDVVFVMPQNVVPRHEKGSCKHVGPEHWHTAH